MIQTGITVLDMNGTTEVSGITIDACPQGTDVKKIQFDMTLASVNASAKVYENYIENTSYAKTLTSGQMVDLDRAIAILDKTVVKLTPAGGGGSAVPIRINAIIEDLAARTLDSDFNTTQKASIQTAGDAAITANTMLKKGRIWQNQNQ